ncbi:MAG: sensor domain-containing diguanylate cyclase [Kineosporiaceae bacterium]
MNPSQATLTSWTTQQLVAFLGTVSTARDEASAVQAAAEAIAGATDSEIGAVVIGGRIRSCIGYGRYPVPEQRILEADTVPGLTLDVPGVGRAHVITAALGRADGGFLLAGRADSPFGASERGMINAMATVLALTLDVLSALDAERAARERSEQHTAQVTELLRTVREQRQLTLDRFSRIQRSIADRDCSLPEVLDEITAAACELVECDVAVLRIGSDEVISTFGLDDAAAAAVRAACHASLGRQAEQDGAPVVDNAFAARTEAVCYGLPLVHAAVAVPVQQGSATVGHLVLASRTAGHRFTPLEESLATTLAEHAGLAVQDAETVDALHAALDDAQHRASHDALTGLANRTTFLAALDRALQADTEPDDPIEAEEGEGPVPRTTRGRVCVLYIDLDYFKSINDTYGHLVGDQLLVVTASRLKHGVREGDVVARLGGDEFAVLLASVSDEQQAHAVAQRLYLAVCRPAQLHGESVWPSASIGVAPSLPSDTHTTVINRADLALYEAKRQGRGQVALYRPDLEQAAQTAPAESALVGGGQPLQQ